MLWFVVIYLLLLLLLQVALVFSGIFLIIEVSHCIRNLYLVLQLEICLLIAGYQAPRSECKFSLLILVYFSYPFLTIILKLKSINGLACHTKGWVLQYPTNASYLSWDLEHLTVNAVTYPSRYSLPYLSSIIPFLECFRNNWLDSYTAIIHLFLIHHKLFFPLNLLRE